MCPLLKLYDVTDYFQALSFTRQLEVCPTEADNFTYTLISSLFSSTFEHLAQAELMLMGLMASICLSVNFGPDKWLD